MDLSIILLRDILSNWDSSTALNAARAYEARQPYSEPDRLMPKRIVPVELGRLIQGHDPGGSIIFIQFKVVPKDYLDAHSTADYAVAWPAGTWRDSTEYRLSANKRWAQTREALLAQNEESSRLHRMIQKITKYLPSFSHIDMYIRSNAENEDNLRSIIQQFEQILKIPIYEPRSTDGRQEIGVPAGAPQSPNHPVQPAAGAANKQASFTHQWALKANRQS